MSGIVSVKDIETIFMKQKINVSWGTVNILNMLDGISIKLFRSVMKLDLKRLFLRLDQR